MARNKKIQASITIDLEEIVDEISSEYSVDEVFSEQEIVSYVAENLDVEDVFDEHELQAWAEENGYERIEEAGI